MASKHSKNTSPPPPPHQQLSSTETSAHTYQTTRRHITGDLNLHSHLLQIRHPSVINYLYVPHIHARKILRFFYGAVSNSGYVGLSWCIMKRKTSRRKRSLTLILLTWRIWWAPNNASRWQMGFSLEFKGLNYIGTILGFAFSYTSKKLCFGGRRPVGKPRRRWHEAL